MCNFLSGIGLKNGDLLTADTDCHEDLVELYNLDDTKIEPNFVRLEYTNEDLQKVKAYKLKIDENEVPDWVTDELRDKWRRKFISRLKNIVVDTNRKVLIGGRYILVGDITIGKLVNCIILDAGNATIKYAGHATIQNAGNATIINKQHAKITKE